MEKCPVCGSRELCIAIVDQNENGDYVEALACEDCGWENPIPWEPLPEDERPIPDLM